jgi:GNAT superfamily N-acetyltransferase
MSDTAFIIRPAHPGEATILTALCLRAKAHWGYDSAFMAAATRLLQIREGQIGAGGVLAARLGRESPCGVAAIVPQRRPNWFELSHLFVAPEHFGRGIGRALFDAAVALAAGRGATHVSILSDPHAAAFYEKLGARRSGEAPSGVARNRMLPLFAFTIPPHRSAMD